MNRELVNRIADVVLYEGYILYPYRPSIKNRQRWTFGGLYPKAFCETQSGDVSTNQTECLIHGSRATTVEAVVRCLHLTLRQVGEMTPTFRPVESLRVGDQLFQTWQEAEEREVVVGPLSLGELLDRQRNLSFAFPGGQRSEPVRNSAGQVVGIVIREQQAVEGMIEVAAAEVAAGLFRVTLRVVNRTPWDVEQPNRDDALLRSLASVHSILGVRHGEFVSLLDPPDAWRAAAAACRNIGTWPVLVGEDGQTDTMLSSPIILYDYPQVAPESPGDFFDGTEIDEMLALRILTLTDDEKHAMAAVDERASALLARTEALGRDQLLGLHGTIRGRIECVHIGAAEIRAGGRVRLCPQRRADIFDLALAGKVATVEGIEQDYDGRVYLAVTVDDDPGKDLGALRQPGHRFFFQPDEVEPLP